MPSKHEAFWSHHRYALVGHSAKAPFPKLSLAGLKKGGKTVYPVDPSVPEVEGVKTFPDLKSLPEKVDGVAIEVPKEEVEAWVRQAAAVGIPRVWIHMKRDTPEALAAAKELGLEVCYGTCAVMYVTPGLTFHSIHKTIRKLTGKF